MSLYKKKSALELILKSEWKFHLLDSRIRPKNEREKCTNSNATANEVPYYGNEK